jgi:hypothetical protein
MAIRAGIPLAIVVAALTAGARPTRHARGEAAPVSAGPTGGHDAVRLDQTTRSFIAAHCLACHDDATREAGVSIEALGDAVTADTAAGWLRVLEQIERGTMPPPEEEQPGGAERRAAALPLEHALIAHARGIAADTTTVLRRLNRTEYRRTVEDLLHLDLLGIDPTRDFPDDSRIHGFASDGERLVTSGFLLRQYLEAADDIVARAIHFEPRPEERTHSLEPPFDKTSLGINYGEREHYATQLRQPQPYQSLFYREGSMPLEALREGVPEAGWYAIRIRAEAKFRDGDIDHAKMFLGTSLTDPSQPLRLEMHTGSLADVDPANQDAVREALLSHRSVDRHLATWDVPDDVPTWLECRVWLERGQFPKFSFPNGPTGTNYRLDMYVTENKYTLLDTAQLAAYETANYGSDWFHLLFFETPRIRIHEVEVRGPINEQWPPPSHRAIFGERPYESAAAGDVLRAFAERAWRRPVTLEEVAPIEGLVRAAEAAAEARGEAAPLAAQSAIAQGVKAVLCAPEFIFREERGDRLDGYEIASRLSYFLWSSLPDPPLLARAAAGDLDSPQARRQEAERLLADRRSDTFVDEFLDGWLRLRTLGTMAPVFPVYFDDRLEPAMRTETRLFFKRLLHVNGPISDFLDADYTFVNRALAKHYGLDWQTAGQRLGEPVEGLRPDDLQPDGSTAAASTGFVQVSLPDRRRGGLLGQAAVLTLTANGVDTSPVIRGSWVLENILGAPPSPPPPNVPVVEPDIRGAKTVRDRLQKHRDSPACMSCHRQIDPPGFALESFDAIGRWRGHYMANNKALAVDSSGEFRGVTFKDIGEFKAALLGQKEQFARCLVEKLLLHALGRELTVADRPAIREIVDRAAADGYRLRDLVLLCCESELLARK